MASGQDLDANAEFVRLADRVVEVPSGSNKNNYANVELIIDVAEREAVDAVWPGWGHASEYPELPDGLAKRNITFIGPCGGPMRALGDKIAASILAQTARVSSIPWSGDGITCDPKVVILRPELFRRCSEQKMTFNVTVSPRRRRRDAASRRADDEQSFATVSIHAGKAMVTTEEECIAAAERIGYPVMLKASKAAAARASA